jgi:hypothetical protein
MRGCEHGCQPSGQPSCGPAREHSCEDRRPPSRVHGWRAPSPTVGGEPKVNHLERAVGSGREEAARGGGGGWTAVGGGGTCSTDACRVEETPSPDEASTLEASEGTRQGRPAQEPCRKSSRPRPLTPVLTATKARGPFPSGAPRGRHKTLSRHATSIDAITLVPFGPPPLLTGSSQALRRVRQSLPGWPKHSARCGVQQPSGPSGPATIVAQTAARARDTAASDLLAPCDLLAARPPQ